MAMFLMQKPTKPHTSATPVLTLQQLKQRAEASEPNLAKRLAMGNIKAATRYLGADYNVHCPTDNDHSKQLIADVMRSSSRLCVNSKGTQQVEEHVNPRAIELEEHSAKAFHAVIDRLESLEASANKADASNATAFGSVIDMHKCMGEKHATLSASQATLSDSHTTLSAKHDALTARQDELHVSCNNLQGSQTKQEAHSATAFHHVLDRLDAAEDNHAKMDATTTECMQRLLAIQKDVMQQHDEQKQSYKHSFSNMSKRQHDLTKRQDNMAEEMNQLKKLIEQKQSSTPERDAAIEAALTQISEIQNSKSSVNNETLLRQQIAHNLNEFNTTRDAVNHFKDSRLQMGKLSASLYDARSIMAIDSETDEHTLSRARDETFEAVKLANELLDASHEQEKRNVFVKDTMESANNFNPVDCRTDTW